MNRYIDAEWLKQNFNTVFWSQVAKTIDSAPTIEIIRCGECKRANYEWSGVRCGLSDALMGEDGFCSIGERRESRDR